MNTKTGIPTGWRWARLGDLIREAQSGFAVGERDPNGVIQLRMNNVTTNGRFDWSSFIRVPADAATIDFYRLLPGDVLFNNTNSTELVGKSALFDGHEETVVYSNHFTRLRMETDLLEPWFLAFWLQDEWRRGVFADICNRWIGQSAVKNDKLLALEIPLPPLTEQHRIAARLNAVMAELARARTAAQAALDAANALPAALLRAVFESDGVKGWEKKRLGEVCRDIADGTHVTPDYLSSGVPFLSVKDIKEYGISFDDCRFISREQHEFFIKRCKPERGDVLYTKVGTTGIAKAIDIDREFSIFVSVALLKLRSDVVPEYLEKVLNAPICREQAEKLTQGMANRNLVLQDVKRIEIPLPSVASQKQISEQLRTQIENARQLRASAQAQVDAINTMPAAYLRKAFRGEL